MSHPKSENPAWWVKSCRALTYVLTFSIFIAMPATKSDSIYYVGISDWLMFIFMGAIGAMIMGGNSSKILAPIMTFILLCIWAFILLIAK
ncbi:MAG: hypothetical protein LBF16_08255 [Pseudomonadales bacterium]|jgi:hypothetical protein|nr:hypothetical protein [Pseudomonadales bacterium]